MLQIILSFLVINLALAHDEWKIEKKANTYLLIHTSKKISHEIEFNGVPEFKGATSEKGKPFTYVDYKAGDYGTSSVTTVYRRVVIDQKNKVLGDLPYRYDSGKKNEEQPQWKVDTVKKEISVSDPVTYAKKVLKYSK